MTVIRLSIVAMLIPLLFGAWPAPAAEDALASLRQTGKAFAAVARAVSPSVVFIQVEGKASTPEASLSPFGDQWPFGDDFFRRFFGDPSPGSPRAPRPEGPQGERRATGQGSGFVFASKDGLLADKTYILTNNHVVANADRIRVRFQDGREFPAKVTGRDPQSDIAVVEIKAGGLPALRWADTSTLEVGEWVVAVGNPFGLSHTLTVGVVSAKGRTSLGINDYEDFIQTDAAINPGNSGGPLVNLSGEVVGVNTAIFSRSGGYMGIGFAIPSNLAKSIADQLIASGEVTRGYLGIVIQELTTDLARSFGIEAGKGILVAQVSKDSPASRGGLRQGDVIISFQGEAVTNVGSFRNRVALVPPGTEVALTLIRDGKHRNVNVTVGERSRDKLASSEPVQTTAEIGLTVQTLTPQLAEQLGLGHSDGVVVTAVRPGSIAARAGIDPGVVILQVDRKPVKTAEQFQRSVNESVADKRLLLLVRRGDAQHYIVLRW
jgi:serine protease Do